MYIHIRTCLINAQTQGIVVNITSTSFGLIYSIAFGLIIPSAKVAPFGDWLSANVDFLPTSVRLQYFIIFDFKVLKFIRNCSFHFQRCHGSCYHYFSLLLSSFRFILVCTPWYSTIKPPNSHHFKGYRFNTHCFLILFLFDHNFTLSCRIKISRTFKRL